MVDVLHDYFRSRHRRTVTHYAFRLHILLVFLSLPIFLPITGAQDPDEIPRLGKLGAKLREIYNVVRNNRMQELSNYFQLHGRPRQVVEWNSFVLGTIDKL